MRYEEAPTVLKRSRDRVNPTWQMSESPSGRSLIIGTPIVGSSYNLRSLFTTCTPSTYALVCGRPTPHPIMTSDTETTPACTTEQLASPAPTPERKPESTPIRLPEAREQSPNSAIVANKSPKTRARKYEIDFLVSDDVEQPPKRTRFLANDNQLVSSPVTPPYPFSLASQKRITLPVLPAYNAVLSLASMHASATPPRTSIVRCSECSFISPHASAITAHARISHPRKPYACGVCGRCFGEKGNMNKHHRTVHLRQRKHSCTQCGRTFAFLDGLNRHISMVHLDRRPFECTFCLCPTSHGPEKPCTHICGMRFKQKSHHRRHLSSVHQIDLPGSP